MLNTLVLLATGGLDDPAFDSYTDQQDQMYDQYNQQQDNAEGLFAFGLGVIIVLAIIGLIATAFWIYTVIDAAGRPEQQWSAINQSKTVWLLILIGTFFIGGALVASLIYFFWPRPKLKAAANGTYQAPTQVGPGGYPPPPAHY